MPIYEYKCQDCGTDFEEIVSVSAERNPQCPSCHSTKTEKKISIFGSFSGSKGNASSCSSSGFS